MVTLNCSKRVIVIIDGITEYKDRQIQQLYTRIKLMRILHVIGMEI